MTCKYFLNSILGLFLFNVLCLNNADAQLMARCYEEDQSLLSFDDFFWANNSKPGDVILKKTISISGTCVGMVDSKPVVIKSKAYFRFLDLTREDFGGIRISAKAYTGGETVTSSDGGRKLFLGDLNMPNSPDANKIYPMRYHFYMDLVFTRTNKPVNLRKNMTIGNTAMISSTPGVFDGGGPFILKLSDEITIPKKCGWETEISVPNEVNFGQIALDDIGSGLMRSFSISARHVNCTDPLQVGVTFTPKDVTSNNAGIKLKNKDTNQVNGLLLNIKDSANANIPWNTVSWLGTLNAQAQTISKSYNAVITKDSAKLVTGPFAAEVIYQISFK